MSYQVKSKIAEVIAKSFNNNSGIMLKDQKISSELKSNKINELIKYYGNKKTNVNLIDLLSPSETSRAKKHPRPLNPFIIFRRNFSKGLKIANTSIGTGPTSTLAAEQWKQLSDEEKVFWKMLSIIAKEIHEQSYPGYKYNPVKSHVKAIEKTNESINLNVIFDNIKSSSVVSSHDLNSNIGDLDNFYEPMDIDLQYNPQDFYFQPTDSILFQNEVPYDINFFDPIIDPALLNSLPYTVFPFLE